MKKVITIVKIALCVIVVIVLIAICGKVTGLFNKVKIGGVLEWFKDEPKITETFNLKKVVEVEELNTLRFKYRGMISKYKELDEDDKEKELEYAFSYDAEITAGIDPQKIKINEDSSKKILYIKLPKVKIRGNSVDFDSIDYLVEPEDLSISQMNDMCHDDAEKEIANSKSIIKYASDNAETIVRSLVEPLVSPEGYKVKIR